MKPIKPKFSETVKVELEVTKKTKEIFAQYARYTQYTEGEILNILASEILQDDNEFINWLKRKRNRKKVDGIIFEIEKIANSDDNKEGQEGVSLLEETEEISEFQ